MDNVVIERNGVRHRLVESDGQFFDCEICTLNDICKEGGICLCNVFRCDNSHFEIETQNNA